MAKKYRFWANKCLFDIHQPHTFAKTLKHTNNQDMKRLKNYLSPSTECWEIVSECQFMASTFKNDIPENSNLNAYMDDDDWVVF